MRRLFQTALLGRAHRLLMGFTIVAMILLTFASQLEIVALGIITRKGPDFFELFAPIEKGKLQKSQEVEWDEVQTRWGQLDPEKTGKVTRSDTVRFLSEYKGADLVEKVTHAVDQWLPIGSSLKALALFLVIVAIFKALTFFCHRFTSRLAAIRVSRDLRQSYFEHIQSLADGFLSSAQHGKFVFACRRRCRSCCRSPECLPGQLSADPVYGTLDIDPLLFDLVAAFRLLPLSAFH